MLIRFLVIAVLINSYGLNASLAKKSPEEIAAYEQQKTLQAEAKKQKALEKQKLKEEKKQKAAEAKKKAQEELAKKLEAEKELLKFTAEDEQKVRNIVAQFATYIGKSPNEYKIKIKSSKIFNASAGLGKELTVYTALFHQLKTEAGLATIIAHEIGHIERKHVVKGVATGVAAGAVGLTLGALTGNSSAVRLSNSVTNTARRAFSRSQERSADLFAIDLMNKVYCSSPDKLEGYKFMLEKEKNIHYAEYLLTHPLAKDRYDYMVKLIQDAGCVL